MKRLPCGCVPSAEWCAYASLLQDALEDAVVAKHVAINPMQLDEARTRFRRAQRELHEHLQEAA